MSTPHSRVAGRGLGGSPLRRAGARLFSLTLTLALATAAGPAAAQGESTGAAPATTQGAAPPETSEVLYTVAPGTSRATFYAHATGHDFSGTTADVRGHVRFDPRDPSTRVSGEVRVGASWIDTGIGKRNRDMLRLLEVEAHPDIVFRLEKIAPEGGGDGLLPPKAALHGELEVRGVRRPLVVPVSVEPAEGAFVVRGEFPADVRDFGIEPPRAMLIIRMQPLVRVELEARFQMVE